MHSEAEFLFWDKNCPFMTNNKNLSKKSKPYMYKTQEQNNFIYTSRQYKYTIFNKHRKATSNNKENNM